jgi:hypothetical protein
LAIAFVSLCSSNFQLFAIPTFQKSFKILLKKTYEKFILKHLYFTKFTYFKKGFDKGQVIITKCKYS